MPEGVHLRATGSTLGERKHSERGNLLDPRSIIRVTNYHPPTHVGTIPASWKSMDGDTCPVPLVKFIDEISDSSSFRFFLRVFYGVNCQNCSNSILKIDDCEKVLEILIRELLIKKLFKHKLVKFIDKLWQSSTKLTPIHTRFLVIKQSLKFCSASRKT